MRSDHARPLGAILLAATVAWCGDVQAQAVTGRVVNGGRGLEAAAVYLIPLDRAASERGPEDSVVVDQVHLTFTPGVSIVAPGTEVSFLNSDDVLHNVFGPARGGREGFDLGTYARGERRSQVFDDEGLNVVLCHVHPEMAMYVIVADTPYRALSEADGSFRIDGLGRGLYVVRTTGDDEGPQRHQN